MCVLRFIYIIHYAHPQLDWMLLHAHTNKFKTALAHLFDRDVLVGVSMSLIVLTSAMAMRYPWYAQGAFVSTNTSSVSVSNALAERKQTK